jgi:hypothetical protein
MDDLVAKLHTAAATTDVDFYDMHKLAFHDVFTYWRMQSGHAEHDVIITNLDKCTVYCQHATCTCYLSAAMCQLATVPISVTTSFCVAVTNQTLVPFDCTLWAWISVIGSRGFNYTTFLFVLWCCTCPWHSCPPFFPHPHIMTSTRCECYVAPIYEWL